MNKQTWRIWTNESEQTNLNKQIWTHETEQTNLNKRISRNESEQTNLKKQNNQAHNYSDVQTMQRQSCNAQEVRTETWLMSKQLWRNESEQMNLEKQIWTNKSKQTIVSKQVRETQSKLKSADPHWSLWSLQIPMKKTCGSKNNQARN